MSTTLQVAGSVLLVMVVLWFMWRLPRRGEALFGWAPPLALLSAWGGLLALAATLLLWVVSTVDAWLVLVLLMLDPGAIATGVLVLWIYRGHLGTSETIEMQVIQAKVGIFLGCIAVAIGYLYVMTHKTPFTPIGS